MRTRNLGLVGVLALLPALHCAALQNSAEAIQTRVVRLAELEIAPAQLDAYKAALREEIEASVRIEPGVLTLYAVSVKDHPTQIRLFEMYATQAAYQAHLQTSHFQRYKVATQHMVTSLRLLETEPISLSSRLR